jgi:hypothetical protein
MVHITAVTAPQQQGRAVPEKFYRSDKDIKVAREPLLWAPSENAFSKNPKGHDLIEVGYFFFCQS